MKRLKIKSHLNHFTLDIDTELSEGLIYGIYGPSASGKTTLLNSLAGYLSHEDNSFVYNDIDLLKDNPKLNIAYVDQESTLIPHMTVSRQLSFFSKYSESEHKKIISYLELDDLLNQKPSSLSGGQIQRVCICLALLSKAQLLLLDEAFSNMDKSLKSFVREKITAHIRERKILTFMVSHDLADIYAMSDHILEISSGKLLSSRSIKDDLIHAVDFNDTFKLKGEVINKDKQYLYIYSGNTLHKLLNNMKNNIKIGDSVNLEFDHKTNQIKLL